VEILSRRFDLAHPHHGILGDHRPYRLGGRSHTRPGAASDCGNDPCVVVRMGTRFLVLTSYHYRGEPVQKDIWDSWWGHIWIHTRKSQRFEQVDGRQIPRRSRTLGRDQFFVMAPLTSLLVGIISATVMRSIVVSYWDNQRQIQRRQLHERNSTSLTMTDPNTHTQETR
jgi:hypothetical protein